MLAAELVGIGEHVVGAAVEYTGARVQYGKAIGTFQALQHRLAGAHALVVGASRLANEAVATGDPWTAMVAKSLAGHAAENACTQAQQCYGAIGFTWSTSSIATCAARTCSMPCSATGVPWSTRSGRHCRPKAPFAALEGSDR